MKYLGESKDHSGYSVFENTNKELVKKIREVTIEDIEYVPGDIIYHIRFGECEVITKIGQYEYVLQKDDHKFVYKLDDKEKRLLQKINDLFDIGDYFIDNFGILASNNIIITGITKREKHMVYHDVQIDGSKIIWYDLSFPKYEFNKGYKTFSCFFDINGNYVNRTYNFDIEKSKKIENIKQFLLDSFLKDIKENFDFPTNMLYVNNDKTIWFNDNYAYSINETINIQPFQNGNKYYENGCSRYATLLTKTIMKNETNIEEFIKHINDFIIKQINDLNV